MEYPTSITAFAMKLAQEDMECLSQVDEAQVMRFYEDIRNAPRIFAYGNGRAQYILRCFMQRLMHLGLEVYIVGDTNTPAIQEGDLFIFCNGAGHRPSYQLYARRAREFGAKVVMLTILKESMCAKEADYTVIIPGATAALGGIGKSIQPGGGKFEESTLILLDAIIAKLNMDMGNIFANGIKRHANLD